MAAGLPVLASAVGALPSTIFDGETGALVPPGDPDALAAAIAALVRQPERLAAMGMAARARVLDLYGPERFAAAGASVLARLATL
jgi:glycosyltransferase involved in cell wall biosynthesis